jgi:hypothetical protein
MRSSGGEVGLRAAEVQQEGGRPLVASRHKGATLGGLVSEQGLEQQTEDLAESLVQLRFSDDAGQLHDLNAAELAEVLQGLVEFTGQMARAGLFGQGMPPEVRIRPTQPGSFVLEAILHWSDQNPEAAVAVAMPMAGGLVVALRTAIKRQRAQPKDFEYLENGNVKILWNDDTADEVPAGVWRDLSKEKRASKKALRKLMAPLSDDVERLEVRPGRPADDTSDLLATPAAVVGDRNDYRLAAVEAEEELTETRTFDVEAQLTSIDFRPDEKWRVQTKETSRLATIADKDFLARLDRGLALHKNDLFDVRVEEVATTRNGRTTREWSLTKINRKRRGGDDGHDAVSSPPEAE